MTTITCALCGADRDVPAVHRCMLSEQERSDREERTGTWDIVSLSRNARSITELIARAGGTPVIVGGTVRDVLFSYFHEDAPPVPKSLDRQFIDTLVKHPEGGVVPGGPMPQDVDVEVHNLPDAREMIRVLREAGFTVVEAGSRFPVYKASRDGEQFDISVVDEPFSDDDVLIDAFGRRDFTANAIGYDPFNGDFIDVYGGINDVHDLVLEATTGRFRDDPLRALRAVQFVSRYGFTLGRRLRNWGRTVQLSDIAQERLWPEWKKLAQGTHIAAALEAFYTLNIDRDYPELEAVYNVPQDPHWHPEGAVHVHLGLAGDVAAKECARDKVTGDQRVIVVLAALFHDLGKAGDGTQHIVEADGSTRIRSLGHDNLGADAARSLLHHIGAPRHIIDSIAAIIREHMVVHTSGEEAPTLPAARRLYRRLGGTMEMVDAWLRVCEADSQGRGPASKATTAYLWAGKMVGQPAASMYKPLLTGRDLIDLGLTPSPLFKRILGDALEAQDDGAFNNGNGARDWVRKHADDYGVTVAPDPFAEYR
ncbi:HD domain-containing protein [Curtobacterium sp. MCSS17_016]|uniref:HD domain-containing protein n=1 Tax=Curtobacterium sp. MCSS17_016 TaxID=2175644 RepID=UPI0015E87B5F|nr:HD domain-containing protein [Curtobacterium sp. MCSS17_016]WIE80888.1 HD domain-containing protein [Curtobacterium sp. MCSS17_016]